MRQEISNDLSSLRGLLTNFWKKNVTNEGVLESVCKKYGADGWQYSFGKAKDNKSKSNYLLFKNIDFGRKIRPQNFNEDCAELNVKLGVRIIADNLNNVCKINELGVNIIVSGYFYVDEEKIDVIQSWHLDKDAPIKRGEERKFTHALYHLNFGGEAMTKPKEDATPWNFGSLLLLETPRIVHHPMDVILAVDFILKNFYHEEKHKEITGKRKYKELLRKAGNRFLKPYYFSLVSKWESDKEDTSMPYSYLLPSLD